MLSPRNQLAILMQVAVDDVGVELIGNAGSARLEILQVLRAPPVFQVALTVELAAVVVKTMCDFMSDDRSHSAVVHRVIGLRIVEGRLQDACRKDDFIHAAVVIGVHGWRRHAPFRAVHGLPNLVQPAREIKFRSAHLVFGVGPAVDIQRRVIAPIVRITDFHRESFEFRGGFGAGVAGPIQGSVCKSSPSAAIRLCTIESPGLGLRRKILLHIDLPEGLAGHAIGRLHAAFPAWLDFLRAGQRFVGAVNIKEAGLALLACWQPSPAARASCQEPTEATRVQSCA
jgi:hypothetical protein